LTASKVGAGAAKNLAPSAVATDNKVTARPRLHRAGADFEQLAAVGSGSPIAGLPTRRPQSGACAACDQASDLLRTARNAEPAFGRRRSTPFTSAVHDGHPVNRVDRSHRIAPVLPLQSSVRWRAEAGRRLNFCEIARHEHFKTKRSDRGRFVVEVCGQPPKSANDRPIRIAECRKEERDA
jgi:hypothetical protein